MNIKIKLSREQGEKLKKLAADAGVKTPEIVEGIVGLFLKVKTVKPQFDRAARLARDILDAVQRYNGGGNRFSETDLAEARRLRKEEGLSYREVAKRMRKPVSTIITADHRTKAQYEDDGLRYMNKSTPDHGGAA